MRCFGGNSRLGQQRSTASCVITRVIAGSKVGYHEVVPSSVSEASIKWHMPVTEMEPPCSQAGCARLRMPFRQLLKPFRACFGPSTEPPVQVRHGVTEVTVGLLWHTLWETLSSLPTFFFRHTDKDLLVDSGT